MVSAPHSHPGRPVRRRARPLPGLAAMRVDFSEFAERHPKSACMLALYDQLIACGGEVLFGSGIMGGGLVLASRADVAMDEGVIVVEYDPAENRFCLSYRHRELAAGQAERCSPAEVWARLRLYIGYKLGVRLREGPDAEASGSGAGTVEL